MTTDTTTNCAKVLNLVESNLSGGSSVGRTSRCQREGRRFDPGSPLIQENSVKILILHGFILQKVFNKNRLQCPT